MDALNNNNQSSDPIQPQSKSTSYTTSPSTERNNNNGFFGQDFFDANLLNDDLLKDLDFDSLDLGYFDELFGASTSGQIPLMNTPMMTFEPHETGGFEHLSALENWDIASLLANDLPGLTAIAPPPSKFVQGVDKKRYKGEKGIGPLSTPSTTLFDDVTELEVLQGALRWNRTLQARIRADLQAIDNGIRMQNEYIKTTARLSIAYKNSLLKHRRPIIPEGDIPDPDPFSLLAQISKTVCKYIKEQDQHALNQADIENYNWVFETLVSKYMFKRALWNNRDKEALAHEIRVQNQKIAFETLLERARGPGTSQISPSTYHEIHHAVQAMTKLDLESNLNGLDWKLISQKIGKTEEECKIQWINHGHPLINDRPWEGDEIKRLRKLTKEMDDSIDRWSRIAEKLGTNRPVGKVIAYYQAHLNEGMFKSKWTQEEDEYLMAAMNATPNASWAEIAEGLDGRTGQQCLHRYTKSLSPGIKHGKWTFQEDTDLTKAVTDCMARNNGKIVWKNIKGCVPNRTDSQCRERWCNALDPSLKKGRWTLEERKLLFENVEKYGEPISWVRIAAEIPGRTDAQCRRRWELDTGKSLTEISEENGSTSQGKGRRKLRTKRGRGRPPKYVTLLNDDTIREQETSKELSGMNHDMTQFDDNERSTALTETQPTTRRKRRKAKRLNLPRRKKQ